jgi:predicted phosphodiesterase
MRFIGDVHGYLKAYIACARKAERSLQVGDMGTYGRLKELDPEKHKFIAGNHEDYAILNDEERRPPHALTGYGVWNDVFYCSGAFSIDKQDRLPGYDWFPEEELTETQLAAMVDAFATLQPEIMATHECPYDQLDHVVRSPSLALEYGFTESKIRTRTGLALSEAFARHKPKLWIFGHHHQRKTFEVEGTTFICLDAFSPKRTTGVDYYDLSPPVSEPEKDAPRPSNGG